jgi:chromosome segregation ATPase
MLPRLVQTTLIFLLGFLSSALIAIAVAPAVWQRACELTRKRIEASMPLTLNEVQADIDQHRAEFAIALRKLEIKAKTLQEKLSGQMADAAIHREKTRVLTDERNAQETELAVRVAHLESLKGELSNRQSDLVALSAVRLELETQIEKLNGDIERGEKTISDLRIDGDNRRIELVTKVTEQDQLNARLRELNLTRKSLEEKLRTTAQKMRAAQEVVRNDAKRLVDLERKAERLVTQMSDRDERLERREIELARVKNSLKVGLEEQSAMKRQLFSVNQRNQQLEREVAKAEDSNATITSVSSNQTADIMKKLEDDKDRLTAMVRQLRQEKDVLVLKLKGAHNLEAPRGDNDAQLRSQVHDLTAKVVSITAETEGAKSPIARLLQTANKDAGSSVQANAEDPALYSQLPESLAERILALQKSARGG